MIYFKAWDQDTEGFKKGLRTPAPTGMLEVFTDILTTQGPGTMVGRDKVRWEGAEEWEGSHPPGTQPLSEQS